jgi:hypothetical protein
MAIKEVELEYTPNTLAKLVRDNYGKNAVEYLIGRLTSVIDERQLKVLIDYEKGKNG